MGQIVLKRSFIKHDVRMEDVEEEVQVLKNDVDIVKIEMSSIHKDF